jgi:hypothetical protein
VHAFHMRQYPRAQGMWFGFSDLCLTRQLPFALCSWRPHGTPCECYHCGACVMRLGGLLSTCPAHAECILHFLHTRGVHHYSGADSRLTYSFSCMYCTCCQIPKRAVRLSHRQAVHRVQRTSSTHAAAPGASHIHCARYSNRTHSMCVPVPTRMARAPSYVAFSAHVRGTLPWGHLRVVEYPVSSPSDCQHSWETILDWHAFD